VRNFDAIIKALSPRAEFWMVLLPTLGWSALGSVMFLGAQVQGPIITEANLIYLLWYEGIALAILIPFLSARGWSRERLGIAASGRSTVLGLCLALLAYIAYAVIYNGAAAIFPGSTRSWEDLCLVAPHMAVAPIIAVSLMNPVFEELLYGYLIAVLNDTRGFWFAVNASVAVRLVCHLYQGAAGSLSIIALGLVFGCFYARTRKLWPLIVGHAVLDFIGLSTWK
jgi:membrane protease YdiL (CAAX protease family)